MKRVIICENIRSLHNVGAIFRNADGAGWHEVWLTGYTGTPPDRRIEKVSLGAEHSIPWRKFETTKEAIQAAKDEKLTIFGLELSEKAEDITQKSEKVENLALIVGNEVVGVEKETLKECEKLVFIPMRGEKASLNVSVASGVAMYFLSC